MVRIKLTQRANRERAIEVFKRLQTTYPEVRCTLDYKKPVQLLIMTILAAQCTDVRVNIVAGPLFKRYPDAQALAKAKQADLEKMIHSCGFYRMKAKNILQTCVALVEQYGGDVPRTMEELIKLPGVGRKTANVLLGECFGGQGVIVDTHCTRVANRLGFTKNQDAVKIEQDLMKVWPPDHWTMFSHYMVFHGRAQCPARTPRCSDCSLRECCPFPDTREGKKIAK